MRKPLFFSVIATMFALFVFAALTAGAVSRWLDERTLHNAAMHTIEERQAAALADVVSPADTILGYTLRIGAAVAVVLILAGSTDAWRNHRAELIAMLRDWLYLRGVARVERAKAQRLPPHIYHEHPDRRPPVIDVVAQQPALALPPPVPHTFGELLDAGQLVRGTQLLLGVADDGPRYGQLRDISATGVGGKRGTGKTTTERYVGAAAAVAGAKFIILDPHLHSGEESLGHTLAPLHHAFLRDPVADDRRILQAIQWVGREMDARLHGRSTDRTIIMVLIDEWTRLAQRSTIAKPLATLVAGANEEGRKVNIFALLAAHTWSGEQLGGTAIRESISSFFVHKMSRQQARMLLPLDAAAKAERLQPGQCVFYGPDGDTPILKIPNTMPSDLDRVAALLQQRAVGVSAETLRGASRNASYNASQASETHKREADIALVKRPTAPDSQPDVVITEAERRDILRAARTPGDDGKPPARRLVCQRVFGSPGGADYEKVKRVLDEAQRGGERVLSA